MRIVHLLILSLILFSCKKEVEVKQEVVSVEPLWIEQVSEMNAQFVEEVISERSVRFFLPVSGVVSKLYVEEGDTVYPDDTIAELEHRELDAEIALGRVEVNAARKQLERIKSLYEKNAKTSVEYEKAKLKYERENARLRLLKVRRARTVLTVSDTVTITGVVSPEGEFSKREEPVCVGETLNKGVLLSAFAGTKNALKHVSMEYPGEKRVTVNVGDVKETRTGALFIPAVDPIWKSGSVVVNLTVKVESLVALNNPESWGDIKEGDFLRLNVSGEIKLFRVIYLSAKQIYCVGDFDQKKAQVKEFVVLK